MVGKPKTRAVSAAQLVGVGLVVLVMWSGAFLMRMPRPQEKLRMVVGMWPGSESFILAREAGELSPDLVNLVEINWASASMKALGNRSVDAAVWSLDEVVRQIGQGYPMKIVLVTDISRGADVILAREQIREVRQLRGLRVGYEPRTAAALMLVQCLGSAGMSLDDVQQVPMNPGETAENFGDLVLDAAATSDPSIHRPQETKLNTIYSSAVPGAEVIRVLAVRADAFKQHRVAVAALVRAHLKWMPRMKDLKKELEPVLRREQLTREAFMQSLGTLEVPTKSQNVEWLTGKDPLLMERMKEIAKQLAKEEPGISASALEGVLDPTLVKEML
jgi:NitT/TauT family transport system substrate-binding protein